ncbi:hypothetical protein CCH79_00007073 [Gambusia affinis]|uniref:Phenylalanine zipper domain-containing protein n=1 Tax=Gambusia affinis TaxID=33528 RepID=A0A315VBL7_GAMAF|nr:hypothetical protein CCH79_00007073 [Gambusia affinis]
MFVSTTTTPLYPPATTSHFFPSCFFLVTAMNGNTIHPANTTSAGGGPSVAAPPRGWREFCELHAIATARQLAGHYRSFASERLQHELVPPETFSKHFTDLFQQHFCQEVDKDGASGSASATAPSPHALINQLRHSTLSQDYREAKRSSGGAASISAVSKVEPVVVSPEPELPLRCAARNSFTGSRSVSGGSLLIQSHNNDEISAADRHQPSERHSSDSLVSGSGGHGDVTHFPVSQIQKTVQWIFQKRQSRSCHSSQDLSPSNPNPATANNSSSNNGDRVDEGSSSSSSSQSFSFQNSEATALPALHRPRVVSHLLEGFRWLRSRSMRLRRLDVSGCCKEGQLKYLLVDDTISDSQPHWQRCRLLVRRIRDAPSGGGRAGSERYQLELYDPPKMFHRTMLDRILRRHFSKKFFYFSEAHATEPFSICRVPLLVFHI